jgi:hypothetical protein
MHFHLPKPLHGWREFAGEVGIIVLGVLIALGLGQVAQAWNDRSNTRDARDAIRAEIASDLGQLSLRVATEGCITKRLTEIAGYLDAASSGKAADPVTWLGKPQQWNMDTFRWDAASQSGRVSLFPVGEQSAFSNIYGSLKAIEAAQADEQRWWAQLRSLEGQRHVSANMVDTLRLAASQARYDDYQVRLFYGQALDDARAMGIKPFLDPLNVGPRSVCIPIRTSREEALKIIHFRFGAP